MSRQVERVGLAGAGTMGTGIAQLAGLAGYETLVFDPDTEALERGLDRLREALVAGVPRGRWTNEDVERAISLIAPARDPADLGACDLVVEAAPERVDLKRELFATLEATCDRDAILATNTSSIPVGDISAHAQRPERIGGMHFFNPPPLMRLVEVVAGPRTEEATLGAIETAALRMGRTPVRCADVPGFIVNRCNRPFTLESLRMLGEGVASAAQIDLIVREEGGYRMGPFELIDLIGVDTNLTVAESFFAQRPEPRWEPHPIQRRLVDEGRLGRKSGRGFHEYKNGRKVEVPTQAGVKLRDAVFERLVAALGNEACYAVEEQVAAPVDVDAAMRLGLNHPRGPFDWLREIGPATALATLNQLGEELGPACYQPSELLRRWAEAGGDEAPEWRSTGSATRIRIDG